MMKNAALSKALTRLERSVSSLDAEDAISAIDSEIAQTDQNEFVPHFEVYKAQVLHKFGKLGEAVKVLASASADYGDVDSVRFFSGQYLLECGKYREAIYHLTECLRIAKESGEIWYLNSAYLMRAYCAARCGDVEQARLDLAQVDDDEEMFWLTVEPPVSKVSISAMLN